jgi:CheY-like chemotaxis protein
VQGGVEVSKKILIVEDESDIRAALVAWLEDEEYEVAQSSNGIDGLAEFERFHPDLALLDMNLPGASGIDLCRRIRQVSSVPLVMFTAVADMEEVQAAIDVGATDFVLKHSGFDELLDRISEHLHVERQHISRTEFDDSYPAQLLTTPETQTADQEGTFEIYPADGSGKPQRPTTADLWTWGGFYFGFREGQNLWTYGGRHVGRFTRDDIIRPDGLYMGGVVDGRLIVDWHKTARRASSFTPSANRGGHSRFADREPFDMLMGYKEFPGPDEV